ncbi:hypothetical protein RF55_20955, partial [Lasius niger]
MVKVLDANNRYQTLRALLDPGSQASFITEACCNQLGLPRSKAKVQIDCLGSAGSHTNGLSKISFTPHFKAFPVFYTEVFVIQKIIGELPHTNLSSSLKNQFLDLALADPQFFKTGPIDILLGVNIALQMLKGEMLNFGDNHPFAVRSELGWIIAGSVDLDIDKPATLHVNTIKLDTDNLVTNFWKLDSVPVANTLTKEELACETHFQTNCSRLPSGRYMVRLPYKISPTQLGESRQLALRRFGSLEKMLTLRPEVYSRYKDFLLEYLVLGHMERVPPTEKTQNPTYYLPHHAVFKESSATTKLRVVFDASVKSSSGLSLNDVLYTGPRVQQELFAILLRFRTFRVAICADTMKMFRQILVHPADADLQRILWRNNPSEPIETFRLITVSYGTSPATYLSTRVIKQLALDERDAFPLASEVCLRDFYVDDLLSGGSTEEEAAELVIQMSSMMQRGGFELHKWSSNVPKVLETVPEKSKAINHPLTIDCDKTIKVLGIVWHPSADVFKFTISTHTFSVITKRAILSEV